MLSEKVQYKEMDKSPHDKVKFSASPTLIMIFAVPTYKYTLCFICEDCGVKEVQVLIMSGWSLAY